MEFILGLLKPWTTELIAGFVAILGIIGVFFKGKHTGKQEEQNRQMKENYDNERRRDNIEERIRHAKPDELDSMQRPWLRDGK